LPQYSQLTDALAAAAVHLLPHPLVHLLHGHVADPLADSHPGPPAGRLARRLLRRLRQVC